MHAPSHKINGPNLYEVCNFCWMQTDSRKCYGSLLQSKLLPQVSTARTRTHTAQLAFFFPFSFLVSVFSFNVEIWKRFYSEFEQTEIKIGKYAQHAHRWLFLLMEYATYATISYSFRLALFHFRISSIFQLDGINAAIIMNINNKIIGSRQRWSHETRTVWWNIFFYCFDICQISYG